MDLGPKSWGFGADFWSIIWAIIFSIPAAQLSDPWGGFSSPADPERSLLGPPQTSFRSPPERPLPSRPEGSLRSPPPHKESCIVITPLRIYFKNTPYPRATPAPHKESSPKSLVLPGSHFRYDSLWGAGGPPPPTEPTRPSETPLRGLLRGLS